MAAKRGVPPTFEGADLELSKSCGIFQPVPAYKAEHMVDLASNIVVAAEIDSGTQADMHTLPPTHRVRAWMAA